MKRPPVRTPATSRLGVGFHAPKARRIGGQSELGQDVLFDGGEQIQDHLVDAPGRSRLGDGDRAGGGRLRQADAREALVRKRAERRTPHDPGREVHRVTSEDQEARAAPSGFACTVRVAGSRVRSGGVDALRFHRAGEPCRPLERPTFRAGLAPELVDQREPDAEVDPREAREERAREEADE
jgi:hypothetical protein